MQYFLFGVVALILGLILLNGFTRANAAVLARQIRVGTGVFALAGAFGLVLRGYASYALPLAALGSWLLWGRGGGWSGFPGPAQQTRGQTSRVVTDHLEMELDHETGELSGRVLKGAFKGRAIESLTPAEMALLWQDCRFTDPPSAQIIEVYLDRVHPSWREDMARADPATAARGGMTTEEAYEVLGLPPGASEEDIRRAHRELMLKLHPDRGGSTYLAAKINQAKELLLGK